MNEGIIVKSFYECACCGYFHLEGSQVDCEDEAERYTASDLKELDIEGYITIKWLDD